MKKLYLEENNLFYEILKLTFYFVITLYPFYLFGSGSIQISHYLLLIFSVLVLISIGVRLDRYFYIFFFFLIYNFLVNIFYIYYNLYTFSDINIKYYKEILFLTYNFIITIGIISFFNKHRKFEVVLYAVITAIIIISCSYIYEILVGKNQYRFSSFFNNPNQLGYFCCCCFSLVYLFYRNLFISYYLMICLIGIIFVISVLTLSKAAYFSLIICILFTIKPFNLKNSNVIYLIFILIVYFFIQTFYLEIIESNGFNRLVNFKTESDSSIEIRGYFVFLESNSLQAVFGMGPENVFDIKGYEIHSTFMMILTSYGLIGFLIFGLLMLFWILDIKKSYGLRGVVCICAPSLLYGLTHNGIRFSMFWIIFALSILMSKELNKLINK